MEPLATRLSFSGDEDLARKFTFSALSYLRALKQEAGFNNLPTLSRQVTIYPGFVISASVNYGVESVNVHLTKKAFEEMKALQELPGLYLFEVVSVEAVPVSIDPTFGGGSTYDSWKVTWKGGTAPYMVYVGDDNGDLSVCVNVDQTIYSLIPNKEFTIERNTYTDPWGAVDSVGVTTHAHVGLWIYDAEGRYVFAPFGGNGPLGNEYKGRFYSFGTFGEYGPPATDSFPMTYLTYPYDSITWSGGISDFDASLIGVVKDTGNLTVDFNSSNIKKRQIQIAKTSGTYWAAVDSAGGTTGISLRVEDSLGTQIDLPWASITGAKPTYEPVELVSAVNVAGVPTFKFKKGIGDFVSSLGGTGFTNTSIQNASLRTGTFDEFALQLVKTDPGAAWSRTTNAGYAAVTDGKGNAVSAYFSDTFGPPLPTSWYAPDQLATVVNVYNGLYSYRAYTGESYGPGNSSATPLAPVEYNIPTSAFWYDSIYRVTALHGAQTIAVAGKVITFVCFATYFTHGGEAATSTTLRLGGGSIAAANAAMGTAYTDSTFLPSISNSSAGSYTQYIIRIYSVV